MKIVFWVSNMWQDILKVQVLDTTSSLSSINEPMEDKNCCEQAKTAYKRAYIMVYNYKSRATGFGGYYGITEESDPLDDYDSLVREEVFTTFIDDSSCDEFKEQIKYGYRYHDIRPYIDKILSDWEECENE